MKNLKEFIKIYIRILLLVLFIWGFIQQLCNFIVIPRTYVRTIHTYTYPKETIINILKSFNYVAEYEVFQEKGLRPIDIYEDDSFIDQRSPDHDYVSTEGLTYTSPFHCTTVLRSQMPEEMLSKVLIHEMLHCYGYNHNDRTKDLMNPVYSGEVSQFNILGWAHRLSDKIRFYNFDFL